MVNARLRSSYRNQLQQRCKWTKDMKSPEGEVVILKEELVVPTAWPLERIEAVFIRVVDARTSNVLKRRSIHRLVPLTK